MVIFASVSCLHGSNSEHWPCPHSCLSLHRLAQCASLLVQITCMWYCNHLHQSFFSEFYIMSLFTVQPVAGIYWCIFGRLWGGVGVVCKCLQFNQGDTSPLLCIIQTEALEFNLIMWYKGREFTSQNISLQVRKRLMQTFVWSVALHTCDTWNIRTEEESQLEALEMWCYKRKLKISWTEKVTSGIVELHSETTWTHTKACWTA